MKNILPAEIRRLLAEHPCQYPKEKNPMVICKLIDEATNDVYFVTSGTFEDGIWKFYAWMFGSVPEGIHYFALSNRDFQWRKDGHNFIPDLTFKPKQLFDIILPY